MKLTLEKLLPLWAEQEPERCRKFGESGIAWAIKDPIARVIWTDMKSDAHDYSVIEYALREAIQARDWDYEIAWSTDEDEKCASVWTSSGEVNCLVPLKDADNIEAIALLAAYLKACGVAIDGGVA